MQNLIKHLQHSTGQDLSTSRLTRISGGDINTAYQLQTAKVNWFIKLNEASLAEMFAAEAAGLQELAASNTVRVPQVIKFGQHQKYAYLILEYIALSPLRSSSLTLFGEQLAALHQIPKPWFGWPIDNTIGSTPQFNQASNDWASFWQQQRLAKQLQFASDNGYHGKLKQLGEQLLVRLHGFFSDYQPLPVLLHGDLWGGNAAADAVNQPVMFDPACYYGDRETDLAMTELFGGFASEFYAAYNAVYPLATGYKQRKQLYNLYHILNHLNLFGSAYLPQANSIIERLLAELK